MRGSLHSCECWLLQVTCLKRVGRCCADCRRNAIHRERETHSSRLGCQEHPCRWRPTIGEDRRLWTVASHWGGILHDEYRYRPTTVTVRTHTEASELGEWRWLWPPHFLQLSITGFLGWAPSGRPGGPRTRAHYRLALRARHGWCRNHWTPGPVLLGCINVGVNHGKGGRVTHPHLQLGTIMQIVSYRFCHVSNFKHQIACITIQ